MSKSVKRILSVAAVVAIPFAAPALAGSAFFAPMAAKLGATGASALVGAGMGAGKAAIFGEDVGRGAAFGALGAGIRGYQLSQAADAANAANAANAGLSAPSQVGSYEQAVGMLGNPSQLTAMQAPGTTAMQNAAASGLEPGAAAMQSASLGAQAASTPGPSFTEALRSVPAEIAARFQDPQAMADLTLRAAGMMAGSLAAGQGLSDQEMALVKAQQQDLEQARRMNAEVFRTRLDEAQKLIGESAYFDPEYFGLQNARRAQMAGDQAKRAGLRGLQGEKRAVSQRQYDLGTARNTGTAYDSGYMSGVQGRLQTRAAGLSALPGAFPSSSGDFSSLMNAYSNADQRKRTQRESIGEALDPVFNPKRKREVYDDELPHSG